MEFTWGVPEVNWQVGICNGYDAGNYLEQKAVTGGVGRGGMRLQQEVLR
jgi:hypothetical protein